MNQVQFVKYINEAILSLPEALRQKIENLAFVLEDEPRVATLQERGIKFNGLLLGLYQGIPLTRRSRGYSGVLPDKITLFKKPIESLAGPEEENIKKLIHKVILHEIGHYFGFNEEKVREWEKRRAEKISDSSQISNIADFI
ncbi:MAG: metallopeptidase family protein [Patescibacteria group bacterium]